MPKFEYADTYVNQRSDIPKEPHWAIIEFGSIHIPGDQRSIDYPGHGYPAHTETSISYHVYKTEQKWRDQIAYREQDPFHYGKKDYIALYVVPAKININVNISVD